MIPKGVKAIRQPDVLEMTCLSRTTLWRRVKAGDFPAPFKLGAGRAVAWLESDVSQWLIDQADHRMKGLIDAA